MDPTSDGWEDLDSALATSAPETDEWEGLDAALQTSPPLQMALTQSVNENPLTARQSLQAAAKTGLQPSTVAGSLDYIARQDSMQEAVSLGASHPLTASWMAEDPKNAAALKEELENAKKIEDISKRQNIIDQFSSDLNRGVFLLGGSAVRSLGLPQEIANYAIRRFGGKTTDPTWAYDNPLTRFFDEEAAKYQSAYSSDVDFESAVKSGNVPHMARKVMSAALESLPATLPQFAAMNAPARLQLIRAYLPMYLNAFGSKMGDLRGAPVSPDAKLTSALGNATFEVVGEAMPLQHLASRYGARIAERWGSAKRSEVAKLANELFVEGIAVEGVSEMATTVGQSASDYVSGVDPQAFDNMGWKLAEAGTVGGVMGGAFTAPAVGLNAIANGIEQRRIARDKQTYEKLNDLSSSMELKKAAPDAAEKLFQKSFDSSGIGKLSVPIEKFNAMCAKSGIDPREVVKNAGDLAAYDKSTVGSAVTLNTAKWFSKYGGTPLSAAMADNFAWRPNVPTAAEIAEEKARKENEASQEDAEDTKAQQKMERELKTDLAAKEFERQLKEKLNHPMASVLATLYASTNKVRRTIMGTPPGQALSRATLQIQKAVDTLDESAAVTPEDQETLKQMEAASNAPEFWDEYNKIPETHGGRIISADNISRAAGTWKGKFAPQSASARIAAQSAVARVFASKIAQPPKGDVLFITGGYGVGKTSAREDAPFLRKAMSNSEVVVEQSSYDYDAVDAQIQEALRSGRKVTYVFVYRTMVNVAADIRRTGRGSMPARTFAREHIGSLETMRRLAAKYATNPHVSLHGIQIVADNVYDMTMEEVEAQRYTNEGESVKDAVRRHMPRVRGMVDYVERYPLPEGKRKAGTRSEPGVEGRPELPESGPNVIEGLEVLPTPEEVIRGLTAPDTPRKKWAKRAGSAPVDEEGTPPPAEKGGDQPPLKQEQTGRTLGTYTTSTSTIEVFAGYNLSTVIHELAHHFTRAAQDDYRLLKNSPNALDPLQKRFVADMDALAKWAGKEDFLQLSTPELERIARGFEDYIREGKSPIAKLRKAFATFKTWMLHVYKSAAINDVPMSDEIREVFDRMLATQEEIDEARKEAGQATSWMLDIPTLPDSFRAKLEEAIKDSREHAISVLEQKSVSEFLRAREKFMREQRKSYREKVAADVSALPVYTHMQKIRESDNALRLDRQMVGEAILTLPSDLFADPGKNVGIPFIGLDPDIVAESLGYTSGEAMLDEFVRYADKDKIIDEITDAKLKMAFPDPMGNADEWREAARAQVHEDYQDKVEKMEFEYMATHYPGALKGLARKMTAVSTSSKALDQEAQRILDAREVDSIDPKEFLGAEWRCQAEAGKRFAKQDYTGVIQAIYDKRLNRALYKEAIKRKKFIDTTVSTFYDVIGWNPEKSSKTRDSDYVNVAKAILARFGLEKRGVNINQTLGQIFKYDPGQANYFTNLIAEATGAQAATYGQLKFPEFVALSNSVVGLWNLAKESKRVQVAANSMLKDEVIQKIGSRIDAVLATRKTPPAVTPASGSVIKSGFLSTIAQLRRMESWVSLLDGGDTGIVRDLLYTPVRAATTRYREADVVLKRELLAKLKPMIKAFGSTPIDGRKWLGPSGMFKDKATLIAALLHTGNRSNLEKLLGGYGWADADPDGEMNTYRWDSFVDAMIQNGTITEADMDFVQSIWDMHKKYLPQVQEVYKSQYGHYFSEVPDVSSEMFGKVYAGGYVPAIADPLLSSAAAIREEQNMVLEDGEHAFTFPTAGMGSFTKRRDSYTQRPLSLDMGMIPFQFSKVLRFVHIFPAVRQTAMLVWTPELRSKLDAYDSKAANNIIVPWLSAAANQRIEAPIANEAARNFVVPALRFLRRNVGAAIMFANLGNVMQQFTGYSVALTKVSAKYLAKAHAAYAARGSDFSDEVLRLSPFMRTLAGEQMYDQHDAINAILFPRNLWEKQQEFIKQNTYFAQKFVQDKMNYAIWMARFNQAIEEGQEDRAVELADIAVRDTQGTPFAEDISSFERGTAITRLFSQFYTYFNGQANYLGKEYAIMYRQWGIDSKSEIAKRALWVTFMGVVMMGAMSSLMMKITRGKLDEDDDGDWWDDIASSVFGGTANYALGFVPIVGGSIPRGVDVFIKGDSSRGWLNTTPVASTAEQTINGIARAKKRWQQRQPMDGRTINDMGKAIGWALPWVPAAVRPFAYQTDVNLHKKRPANYLDYARGLVTGR